MRCPFCSHFEDKVVDSRETREGLAIRRRRECLECHRRFTTYERVEDIAYMVIKKGGHREQFQRSKVLRGLMRACEKRPVSRHQLETLVDMIEKRLVESTHHEIASSKIGQVLMEELRRLDKVAYVRFASVYLDFKSVKEFMDEINQLV